MGYDMYCDGVSDAARAEAEACRERGFALYAERDALGAAAVPKRGPDGWGWDEATGDPEWWRLQRTAQAEFAKSDALRGYFRLNVWGMGRCCDLMARLGMMDTEQRSGRWPKPNEFGLTEYPDEDDGPFAEGSPEARFLTASEAVRRGSGAGLIPAFKFNTNDGWLVTPDEIRRSLAVIIDCVVPSDPPWFQSWLDYLAKAADLGGFRVR